MKTNLLKNGLKFCAIALLCMMTGVALASDYVDYDKSFDFSSLHTFQLLSNPDGALAKNDPLLDSQVQDAIRKHLVAEGLTETTDTPDIIFTYDAKTQQHQVYNTMGMRPGIGFGVGWGRFGGVGMGMATTTESTFTDGTLIIDGSTPDPKKMVWRGIAEESVSANSQKTLEHIEKSLDKLFEKWDKIKNNKD